MNILHNKTFSRRVFIIIASKLFIFTVLAIRLLYLQIIRGKHFKILAENNRSKIDIIVANRGLIIDRNDNPMVINKPTTKVYFNPQNIKDYNVKINIIKQFYTLLNIDEIKLKHYLAKGSKLIKKNPKQKLLLYKHLNIKEITTINFFLPSLPGISIEESVIRYYTLGSKASHITGYISPINQSNAEQIRNQSVKKLYQNPEYKIGSAGIEKRENDKLVGKFGLIGSEVNASGSILGTRIIREPEQGENIKLTIDSRLQTELADTMSETGFYSGSGILMDIKTGDILAMHSSPSFDPNQISKGIDNDMWKNLTTDERGLMLNKAINSAYSPGSTFKVISALTALESGVNENFSFKCNGEFKYGNRTYHCWKDKEKGGHGVIRNIKEAIAKSCNVYFYKLATMMDIDDIANIAKKFGLGTTYDLNIGTEKIGIIPDRKWKKERLGENWIGGETLNTVIGQGYLLITPLQLCVMIGRVASGKMIVPEIIFNEKKRDFRNIILENKKALNIVQDGLFDMFNTPGGNNYRHRIATTGMEIAGKTGTMQTISRRIKASDMLNNKVQESFKSHGLFVGYAPAHDPKYAISIFVERGVWGSSSAVPIARKVLLAAMNND